MMRGTPNQRRTATGVARAAGSTALVVLGALLLALSIVALWANDTLFDGDRFSGTAVDAVQQAPVRAEITRVVVEQLIAQKPDLITVRPLLETVANTAITSPFFKKVLISALLQVHHTLFDTERGTLVLNLSDAMILVINGLKAFDATLVEGIPAEVQAGLITIAERNYATALVEIADDVALIALVLPLLALLAFAAAILLSRNRRGAVTSAGIATALAAVFLWLALDIGRGILLDQFSSEATADAVRAVWDTFLASLHAWLWVMGIAGVVLAAAASATLRVAEARAQLEALRRRLTTIPDSRAGRLVYAAGALLLGAVMVAYPDSVVSIAVRAAGLLALYFGGTELLRLTGLAAHAQTEGARPPKPLGVSFNPRPLAGAALAVACVFAGLVLWFNRDTLRGDSIAEAGEIQRCNGFSALCDRPLNEVAFAGSHNSMSAARSSGWYLANHDGTMDEQLNAGIRAFLIDAHYGFNAEKGVRTDFASNPHRAKIEAEIGPEAIAAATRLGDRMGKVSANAKREVFLCHGFCELGATPLVSGLRSFTDFLKANPHDVLIIFFEDYVSPEEIENGFKKSGLDQYVYTHTPGQPWPTLRQMIEAETRVLVLSENAGDQARPAWYHDGWALAQETTYQFSTIDSFVCTPNRGKAENSLFLINHWLEKMPSSPGDAAIINAYDFLLARARRCQQERVILPNIFAINFFEIGDLLRVTDALNGVDSSQRETPR